LVLGSCTEKGEKIQDDVVSVGMGGKGTRHWAGKKMSKRVESSKTLFGKQKGKAGKKPLRAKLCCGTSRLEGGLVTMRGDAGQSLKCALFGGGGKERTEKDREGNLVQTCLVSHEAQFLPGTWNRRRLGGGEEGRSAD